MPPSPQGLIRPCDLVGDAMRDARGETAGFRSLGEIIPRTDPAPPETLLGSVAHAGDVDERLAQHRRPRSRRARDSPCWEVREGAEKPYSRGRDGRACSKSGSEPGHAYDRAAADVAETVRRAHEAVSLRGDMALVGAVQGGLHPDLRERCARSVSSLDVAVCAIGGVVPLLETYRFRDLARVIIASKKGLDPSKPVHLFGAGHPLVFPLATLLGCDLFDSASYAKYARDGRMLFADGTRRAADVRESGCLCPVCTANPMEKIASEETLLAEHNLHACFGAIREVRQAIAEGDLWGLAERRARGPPALLDRLRGVRRRNEILEEVGPGFPFGILWEGETTLDDLRARAPGGRAIDWNALRIRATADFQFGRGAADALFAGAISYVMSKNTGKVRNVLADGEHVVSLRAADGLFTLKAAGARRLAKAFPPPRLRIVVAEDTIPFP